MPLDDVCKNLPSVSDTRWFAYGSPADLRFLQDGTFTFTVVEPDEGLGVWAFGTYKEEQTVFVVLHTTFCDE